MGRKGKKTRIAENRRELLDIFGKLDGNKLKTACGLIDRAAFQRVELEDLEEKLREEGWTEPYDNGGGQSGIKKSTSADVYLNLSKTYASICKQLLELCPDAAGESRLEAMMRSL